jgi:hypothetical protein
VTGTDFPQQHFRTSGPSLSASRISPRIGLLAATIFCFGQVSGCGGGFFRTGIRQRASRFVESGEHAYYALAPPRVREFSVAVPATGGERREQATIETAWGAQIGVLDHRILSQPGKAQLAAEPRAGPASP